jgi:hypothetical protein
MKKTLLFFTMLVISSLGFSQTYLLQEFFNDTVNLPANFTTIDQDGDGYNWRINTWDGGDVFESYAVSDSWMSEPGPLTPENYLVTPKISLVGLSGTVKVRYTVQVASFDYPADKYKVVVSTTGNQVDDFTHVVFTEVMDTNAYYVWVDRYVDLTSFIGDSIYLSWCHFDCTDMYKLLLDSIQVIYEPNDGIGENQGINAMVYPNPASNNVTVSGDFMNARLELVADDGRVVYFAENRSQKAVINVASLEKGMYLLRIQSSKGISTRKVAVTH